MAVRADMAEPVGRESEREVLETQLARARQGMSAVLAVHGEAGMGKTTLLDEVSRSAEDMTVAHICGIDAERTFGFAALHRLLVPHLELAERLPERQRAALDAAFGTGEGDQCDQSERYVVGLATITLLAEIAAEQPLLCIVDDAQWIDRESFEALSFAGRRFHAERIALLLGMRDSAEGGPSLPGGWPTLHLDRLTPSDASRLLTSVVSTPLDSGVAVRLVDAAQGSPFALVELIRALGAEQLSGGEVLPDPLPLGNRLERHFLAQVEALPPTTQTLLLLAAAERGGDSSILWAAAERLDLEPSDAVPAEERGLLSALPVGGFRHPLIRSAVYAGASPSARRRVHAVLAAATDPKSDRERWAWHRGAAALGPDEEVAAALERCADQARDRGGYATEAAFRTRAADLTPGSEGRAARLLGAAQSNVRAGAPQAAAALLDRAKPDLVGVRLQADARRLAASLESYTIPGEVPRIFLEAARSLEDLDIRLARDSYTEALQACFVSYHLTNGTSATEIATAALAAPRPPSTTAADVLLDAFATRFASGYVPAVPKLKDALASFTSADADKAELQRWVVLRNNLAQELWNVEDTRAMLLRFERYEREHGALDSLHVTLGGLAYLAMWRGDFAQCDSHHSEATQIGVALGGDALAYDLVKAELIAWQGRDQDLRPMADLLTSSEVEAIGAGIAVNIGRSAITLLALGRGRYREAYETAQLVFEDDPPPYGNPILPNLIEAATRCGEAAAAAAALTRLQKRALAAGTSWALGLLARAQGLCDDGAHAEQHFEESLEHLGRTPVTTDLARSHLVYGEWLRRANRRLEARDQLRTAHAFFERMGAAAFEARARLELAATGERARKRSVEHQTDLTPQELQIAHLAATGATNPEIATQLFLSASTVDYHLRKVFKKLGLTSRRQLADALHA